MPSAALALALLVAALAEQAGPPSALPDGFTAIQVTTTDPDRFVADWAKPGPGAKLQVQNRTVRGRSISAFIIFKGCKADAAGACDVTARFRLVAPSGAPSGPEAAIAVWPKRPPVLGNVYSRSVEAFTVGFGATDALGEYRLTSDVTDQVSGATVHLEGSIILAGK